MLPAAILKASSAGTPAKSRSAKGRVFGQSHSMCGKSVANMMRSTPMRWPSSIAKPGSCGTLKQRPSPYAPHHIFFILQNIKRAASDLGHHMGVECIKFATDYPDH